MCGTAAFIYPHIPRICCSIDPCTETCRCSAGAHAGVHTERLRQIKMATKVGPHPKPLVVDDFIPGPWLGTKIAEAAQGRWPRPQRCVIPLWPLTYGFW